MKKLIITLSIVFLFAVTAIAQPKAIGLRLGYNAEASYQHFFGKNFIQLDAGTFYGFRGVSFSPTFNFSIAKPNWTPKGEWEFYAGPGLSTGYFFGYSGSVLYKDGSVKNGRHGDYFYLGLSGMFGLSYTFWFPLQLSVDFRPTLIGFQTIDQDHYSRVYGDSDKIAVYSDFWWDKDRYSDRFFYPNIALSVRYAFGK